MLELGLYQGYFVSCFVVIILGFLFVLCFSTEEDNGYLRKLFIVSLLLKLTLVLIYYAMLVNGGLHGFILIDDKSYHANATGIANAWLRGSTAVDIRRFDANVGFQYFCAFLYYIFGPNTLIVRVFNALAGTLCIYFVYETARLYFERSTARKAAFLMAFFPTLVLWSGQQLKESLLILTTSMIMYFSSLFLVKNKLNIAQVTGLIFAMIAMYTLRYAIAIPFCLIVILYTYFVSIKEIAIMRILIVSFVFYVAILGVIRITKTDLPGLTGKFQERFDLATKTTIGARRGVEATADSIVTFAAIRSYRDFYKLPVGMFFVMIMPYPPLPALVDAEASVSNKLVYLHVYLYVILLSFILAGGFYIFKNYTQKGFLLYFTPVFFIAIAAWSAMGIVRYREQWIPYFALMAAVGIEHRKTYGAFIMICNIFILLIAPIGYWIIKS